MSSKLRTARFITLFRPARSISQTYIRPFTSSQAMAVIVDSHFISQITAAEKIITKSDKPVKGGPTARVQSHVGQELTAQVVHDITTGERVITGKEGPVQGGPTSVAQSILSSGNASNQSRTPTSNSSTSSSRIERHSGHLDSETMSKITEKEKEITGQQRPVKGGPTAKAQQHLGEPITSEALHDITEGEKKITGGERIKGGPTSAVQSELGKSRS